MSLKTFKIGNNEVFESGSCKANKMVVNLSNKLQNDKSKNLTPVPNIKTTRKPTFQIFDIKKTFNCLKQVFIKAPIL